MESVPFGSHSQFQKGRILLSSAWELFELWSCYSMWFWVVAFHWPIPTRVWTQLQECGQHSHCDQFSCDCTRFLAISGWIMAPSYLLTELKGLKFTFLEFLEHFKFLYFLDILYFILLLIVILLGFVLLNPVGVTHHSLQGFRNLLLAFGQVLLKLFLHDLPNLWIHFHFNQEFLVFPELSYCICHSLRSQCLSHFPALIISQ